MRGKYINAEERREARQVSAELVVPALLREELLPIKPWLDTRTGIVALDIGANKGFWAKALLNLCGDRVRHIYLVEPSPENYRELTRRDDSLMFAAGDFDKMSVHQYAMGSSEGQVTLYTNEDGSPLASLYPHAINGYGVSPMNLTEIDLSETIEVPATTVDHLIERNDIPHIDIMKLDVEGHEYEVLRGARRALERGSIDIISMEFGIHQVESRHFFKDFYTLFASYGFSVYFIRNDALHEVSRYEYQYEDLTSNFQIIAQRQANGPQPGIVGLIDGKSTAPCAGQDEIAALRALYEQSTSWRITAPLRRMARLLGRKT